MSVSLSFLVRLSFRCRWGCCCRAARRRGRERGFSPAAAGTRRARPKRALPPAQGRTRRRGGKRVSKVPTALSPSPPAGVVRLSLSTACRHAFVRSPERRESASLQLVLDRCCPTDPLIQALRSHPSIRTVREGLSTPSVHSGVRSAVVLQSPVRALCVIEGKSNSIGSGSKTQSPRQDFLS